MGGLTDLRDSVLVLLLFLALPKCDGIALNCVE